MDKEAIKAILAELLEENAPVKTQTRAYVKTDVRVQNLLQELVECDVAYKEALNTRKEAEARASISRARIEEILVEARKLKVPQTQLAEALNISRGAISSRMTHARRAVRTRARNKTK